MDFDSAAAPKLNKQSDIEAKSELKILMDENVKIAEEASYAGQLSLVTPQKNKENHIDQNTNVAIENNSTIYGSINEDENANGFEQIIGKLPQEVVVSESEKRNDTGKGTKQDISHNIHTNDDGEKDGKGQSTDHITAAIDKLRLDDIKQHTFQTDNISIKYFNRRFLDQHATTYELENFSRNKMLIFNQVYCPGETPREGTDKDVAALTECFQKRAFEVDSFHDCTKDELFDNLENAIGQDLSDYGCFAVVILTHGSYDGLLLTKEGKFYESQLVDTLKGSNAPGLLTKPKLLIIQACRGDGVSRSAPVGQMPKGVPFQHDSPRSQSYAYTMAEESDFLIIHSTFPGMKAHRGKEYGTWFIQSLCKFINDSEPYEDMSAILTRVRRDVSINHENSGFTAEDKQMPEVTTTLTRTLYLNSGIKVAKKHLMHSVETAPSMIPANTSRKIATEEQPEEVQANSNKEANSSKDEEMKLNDNDYVVDRDFVQNGMRLWEGDVIHNVKNISDSWRFGIFMRINRWLPEQLFTSKDGETPKVRPWRDVPWHVSNHCRAKFEYRNASPGHLHFRAGDLIAVLKKNVKGDDWWSGRKMDGKTGIFPRPLVFLLDSKLYNCSREMCGESWNGDHADTQQWYKEILDLHGPRSRSVVPVKTQLCPNCLNYILELPE